MNRGLLSACNVVTLVTLLTFCGCATKARVYKTPDHSALTASGQRLASSVAQAHVAAGRARTSLGEVGAASKREGERIAVLTPKLDELLRVAPVELRPDIEALQVHVGELQTAHSQTEAQIAATHRAQAVLAEELERATAAKNEHAKEQSAFIAKADHLAQLATDESAARAKAEKSLQWYRLRWWASWIVLGLGIVAAGFFAVLKFAGKLSV